MPILALDTSAAVAVALTEDDGAVLAARSFAGQRHHAEQLAPLIALALADAGLDRGDIDAVVVGTGPAPFTGLRVGLVTARAFAFALGVPVYGVSSLDALALAAARDLAVAPGGEVLVVTDARRREVYWARYRVARDGGVGVGADGRGCVDGVAAELIEGPGVEVAARVAAHAGGVVVGRGASLYPADLQLTPGAPLDPDPADLVRLALARLARASAAADPERTVAAALATTPLYLRRPDAVPANERKRVLA